MLGGTISVECELGRGSTFTLKVETGMSEDTRWVDPLKESAHVYSHVTDVTLECHVLVVDDRRNIRFMTRKFLTGAGATVMEAKDGEIAVAAVKVRSREAKRLILSYLTCRCRDSMETKPRTRCAHSVSPIRSSPSRPMRCKAT